MSCGVALGFLGYIGMQGLGEVNPGLVGYSHQHPQHVGQLIGQGIGILAGLERLVTVSARHYAGHLAHFLGEYSHIGERRKVAHTYGAYPLVHHLLRIAQAYVAVLLCHY